MFPSVPPQHVDRVAQFTCRSEATATGSRHTGITCRSTRDGRHRRLRRSSRGGLFDRYPICQGTVSAVGSRRLFRLASRCPVRSETRRIVWSWNQGPLDLVDSRHPHSSRRVRSSSCGHLGSLPNGLEHGTGSAPPLWKSKARTRFRSFMAISRPSPGMSGRCCLATTGTEPNGAE